MKKDQPIINPAAAYLTGQAITPTEQKPAATGLPIFAKRERRTAHISLLVKPSTAQALREKAAAAGTSLNDYINYILEQATEGE